jgi:hypothetical protein
VDGPQGNIDGVTGKKLSLVVKVVESRQNRCLTIAVYPDYENCSKMPLIHHCG